MGPGGILVPGAVPCLQTLDERRGRLSVAGRTAGEDHVGLAVPGR